MIFGTNSLFSTFLLLVTVWNTRCQNSLSSLSGADITAVMSTFSDKCPTTTADGQNWAPLPADGTCGSVKRCDFPNQWCAFKLGADGTPDLGSLNCQPLTADCKKVFLDTAGGGGGGESPAPGSDTTAAGGSGTTPGAGSAGTTPQQETTVGLGGSSPVAGGETSTSGGATSAMGGSMETSPTTPTLPVEGGGTSPATGSETTTGILGGGGVGGESTAGTSPAVPTEAPLGGSTGAPGPTTGAGGGGGTPSGDCCDYHEFCCFWASTGNCDSNKPFMSQICQKSCGMCGCSGASCPVAVAAECSGGSVPPGTVCPCKSDHPVNKDWNPKCSSWAANGDCDKNASYMKPMCKASCNVCK